MSETCWQAVTPVSCKGSTGVLHQSAEKFPRLKSLKVFLLCEGVCPSVTVLHMPCKADLVREGCQHPVVLLQCPIYLLSLSLKK